MQQAVLSAYDGSGVWTILMSSSSATSRLGSSVSSTSDGSTKGNGPGRPSTVDVAAPGPILRARAESGFDRIPGDVSKASEQMLFLCHVDREVAAANAMAAASVSLIVVERVRPVDPFHRIRQHVRCGVDEQVVVRPHETRGHTRPVGVERDAFELADEAQPVGGVPKEEVGRRGASRQVVDAGCCLAERVAHRRQDAASLRCAKVFFLESPGRLDEVVSAT